MSRNSQDPHKDQPVIFSGTDIEKAKAAVILIHGRGATAEEILGLSNEFSFEDFIYAAPQAAGNTWYPKSFLAPAAENEPGLSSGLKVISDLINHLINNGMKKEKIILIGFSQGACLALEFAGRNAARFGGIAGLSGGLIGDKPDLRNYKGSFSSAPVFIGCSDIDPHIPLGRVEESAEIFSAMGASVTKKIYPGMGHTINNDEISFVRNLCRSL